MKISKVTLDKYKKILKVALWVGASASLDYLISVSTGTMFGALTVPINVTLVAIKQLFTDNK